MNTMTNDGLSADINRDATSAKIDMAKAREIIRRHGTFQGAGAPRVWVEGRDSLTQTQENIAIAIAEGIAWGRKEGIAMAAEAVACLKGENDAWSIRREGQSTCVQFLQHYLQP